MDLLDTRGVNPCREVSLLAPAAADDESSAAECNRLIHDVCLGFGAIRADQVGAAIEAMLAASAAALGAERSSVLQTTAGGTLTMRFDVADAGIAVSPSGTPAGAALPGLARAGIVGEPVHFSQIGQLQGAREREELARLGVKSGLAVPLRVRGRVVGALSYAMHTRERCWSASVVERAGLVAALISAALAVEHAQSGQRQTESQLQRLREEYSDAHRRDRAVTSPVQRMHRGLVAESAAIQRALVQVEHVAPTSATVLLAGETGVGKEVFAQTIHDLSARHKRPMVRVNCGAIPAALIESELFGRERGAYTGALSRQAGRFELAEGSTIFLDEVGELPLEAQVKLLRVLQEREVERLGGSRPIKVDVRVIAASNKKLQRCVEEGTFREDLFYRLNVFPITVPPLRERVADIPVLIWTFIDEYSKAFGKPVNSLAKESLMALQQYAWPGNVRELRNTIERAVITATEPHLTVAVPRTSLASRRRSVRLADVEVEHIRSVLDETGWRVRGPHGAAALLGLKPTTLESRMQKLGVSRGGAGRPAGGPPGFAASAGIGRQAGPPRVEPPI